MAKNDDYNGDSSPTAIGAAVKIEGDLIGEGDVRVEGVVTGTVKTSRNLYVGPSAKLEADIEAENAIIAGEVKGEINVKGGAVLEESARVKGNITCNKLAVSEGAHFVGNCNMPEAGEAAVLEEKSEEEISEKKKDK